MFRVSAKSRFLSYVLLISLFIFQICAIAMAEQNIRMRFGQESTKAMLDTFGTASGGVFVTLRFTLSRFSRTAHFGKTLLTYALPKNFCNCTPKILSCLSAFDRWIALIGAEQKAVPHSDMVLLI